MREFGRVLQRRNSEKDFQADGLKRQGKPADNPVQ
jgi:hypothetical protein